MQDRYDRQDKALEMQDKMLEKLDEMKHKWLAR